MWQYLLSLKEREGITLLLTTHYLEEVEQLCDRAAIIVDGQIIKEGRVKNLLKSMDFETYILETDLESEKIKDRLKQISDLEFKTNPEDIEITIQKKEPLNNLFEKLSKAGIKVISLRPKGNRLEELFLRVVKKSAIKNKA
jgi:ABC-2 type transport system ATP-binding protein